MSVPDDYSMPHWINLSFYSTNKKIPNSTFLPRIKLPQKLSKSSQLENNLNNVNGKLLGSKPKLLQEDAREYLHNNFFDYDAYDAQVFQIPSIHASNLQRVSTRTKKTSVVCMETHNNAHALRLLKRKMSDPDIHHPSSETYSSGNSTVSTPTSYSAAISIPSNIPIDPVSNVTANETTGIFSIPKLIFISILYKVAGTVLYVLEIGQK